MLINHTWWVDNTAAGPVTPMWHSINTSLFYSFFLGLHVHVLLISHVLVLATSILTSQHRENNDTDCVAWWKRKCTPGRDYNLCFLIQSLKLPPKHTLKKEKHDTCLISNDRRSPGEKGVTDRLSSCTQGLWEKRRAHIRQVSKFTAGCGDRWRSEAVKVERQQAEGSEDREEKGGRRKERSQIKGEKWLRSLDFLASLWELHWDYISLAFLTFTSHKSETALKCHFIKIPRSIWHMQLYTAGWKQMKPSIE